MKPLRSVHLIFILTALCVIAFFWFGFFFGKESQKQEDLLKMTEEQIVETGFLPEPARFYLKEKESYVCVYVSATDELYFESDLAVDTLPEDIRNDLIKGIDFSDLEAVYAFLENYSS